MQRALLNEYRRLGRNGHGPRPLAYVRLRQALRGTIESGAVGPGQALPGERELGKWLALSRVTVRKAISGLVGAEKMLPGARFWRIGIGAVALAAGAGFAVAAWRAI